MLHLVLLSLINVHLRLYCRKNVGCKTYRACGVEPFQLVSKKNRQALEDHTLLGGDICVLIRDSIRLAKRTLQSSKRQVSTTMAKVIYQPLYVLNNLQGSLTLYRSNGTNIKKKSMTHYDPNTKSLCPKSLLIYSYGKKKLIFQYFWDFFLRTFYKITVRYLNK